MDQHGARARVRDWILFKFRSFELMCFEPCKTVAAYGVVMHFEYPRAKPLVLVTIAIAERKRGVEKMDIQNSYARTLKGDYELQWGMGKGRISREHADINRVEGILGDLRDNDPEKELHQE